MTLTGKLTDYEGDVARINDQPKKMLPAAAKWCADRLRKGMTVDYNLVEDGEKKGWISKIWERKIPTGDSDEKRQAAGFNNPIPPAGNPGIKTVEGQIVGIDYDAHKINVKDRAGQQHVMIWPPPLHDQMCKLKQWWFTKITGEFQADVELWKLTAQDFFRRPDDWPASQHGGGGWKGQPRNEKLILVEVMLKAYAELWPNCHTPDTVTFKAAREEILAAVEEDLPRVLKMGAGGA